MKKLTKKILTGLTAASIAGVALLPTSATAHDFDLQLTTTIAQVGLFSTNGGQFNIAANPAPITLTYNPANNRIDAVNNLVVDFLQNNYTAARDVDIQLTTPSVLTHLANNTDNIPIELVVNGQVLTNTGATTLNIAAGARHNLELNQVDTTGKPAGTYTGNITIQITETP